MTITKKIMCGLLILSVTANYAFAQQGKMPASPVKVAEVKQSTVTPTVEIVGTVYSRHNVMLTAGVNGRLDWVAEPGSIIEKGNPIAKIDRLPLTLQQAQQKAEIKRAEINLRYLKRELDRLTDLRKTNSASAFQFDQTQSQYDLAKADLEIADLRLQQIEDQLGRTTVPAPFTGVVIDRLREAGGDVNRSEQLVRFLDTENLEARVFVPVKYLPFVRQTEVINIESDSHTVQARVKALIPSADTRSQSFELRLSLPEQTSSIWTAGQLVKASLPVQSPQTVLTVHRDALILRREGTYVVVIDNDNKAHREKVIVGEGQDEWVSVKGDNLHEGVKVATRGAERLRDGQEVMITSPAV